MKYIAVLRKGDCAGYTYVGPFETRKEADDWCASELAQEVLNMPQYVEYFWVSQLLSSPS